MSGLPITEFRSDIVAAVNNNAVTICEAETGAGKSTQVPKFLLDEGYRVTVTQPRRLAARSLAERVSEELGGKLGQLVGYQTAVDKLYSQKTRCMFVTDGLQLVHQMVRGNTDQKHVLILDEVHEWNLNIEVLVAWTRQQIKNNPGFKLLIMSATMESDKLSKFFNNAPVISVPGRLFPITEKKTTGSIVHDVISLANDGRNVLVFMPGKAEINKTIEQLLELTGGRFKILPLHGELDSDEQSLCFKHYGKPKIIVSTNVAQTSVTIDDIDAVVDSGEERRIELSNGIEGLYIRPISLSDSKQRSGRAGRTKPGVYVDCCSHSFEERRAFAQAEIERVRLDQTVLRLAEHGFDMEELEFFHQPEIGEIRKAKDDLKKLGCMDENGAVTAIGKKVAKLPVSVSMGRMIVEADRRGCMKDIITAAAIMEVGQLHSRKTPDGRENYAWLAYVKDEKESDVLAQLNLYEYAVTANRNELLAAGIHIGALNRVRETRKNIEKAVSKFVPDVETVGSRLDVLLSICAGMVNHTYSRSGLGYISGSYKVRNINKGSVVSSIGTELIVGIPFDLSIKGKYGNQTLNLIQMVTKVTIGMLHEVAPQLFTVKKTDNAYWSQEDNCVMSSHNVMFNGTLVGTKDAPDPDHPDAVMLRVSRMYSDYYVETLPEKHIRYLTSEDLKLTEYVVGQHPKTGEDLYIYGTYSLYMYEYAEYYTTRVKAEAEELNKRLRERASVLFPSKPKANNADVIEEPVVKSVSNKLVTGGDLADSVAKLQQLFHSR